MPDDVLKIVFGAVLGFALSEFRGLLDRRRESERELKARERDYLLKAIGETKQHMLADLEWTLDRAFGVKSDYPRPSTLPDADPTLLGDADLFGRSLELTRALMVKPDLVYERLGDLEAVESAIDERLTEQAKLVRADKPIVRIDRKAHPELFSLRMRLRELLRQADDLGIPITPENRARLLKAIGGDDATSAHAG